MQTITGKFTSANVMTDSFEQECHKQILDVCNQEVFKDTRIRVMPDCHAGAGCVIGFTMPITNFVIPNLIGVDIGCSVTGYCLGQVDKVDFKKLDEHIRKTIPSGFNARQKPLSIINQTYKERLDELIKRLLLKEDRVYNSIGTLGGGNHFIELGRSEKDNSLWIFIHSGSRNLGKQVADYHQKKAKEFIEAKGFTGVQRGLEYLLLDTDEGKQYMCDMFTAQEYAQLNTIGMINEIMDYPEFKEVIHVIPTIHNYVNPRDKIIRKGAIQANEDQEVVIPLNMRDGVIIGKGKGNPDWNNSAPHGAGRVLARGAAKRTLELKDFQSSMEGVWSSCITKETIDESPMAYKPKEEILKYVGDTIDIIDMVKPIYNFKAVE